jgi:hypothetical protein
MDDYYIINCQQINHRGGGFLIDIRFQGDGYWLRRQEREDTVDGELFYRLRLDERQPLTSRPVSVATLAEIVAGLQGAAVPALPAVGGGFDGIDYTLAIQAGLNRAVYTWWLDVPAGWQPIAAAWHALVALSQD